MSVVSWRDSWHMRRTRADYYTYLGDLLGVLAGRRSLADVFADDARRYGPATARGRVAAIWCDRLEVTGGDLAQTWTGSFPAADLALIEVAQHAGSQALAGVLIGLGETTLLAQRLRSQLWQTVAAGVAAWVVVWLLLWAMPSYTVPRLAEVFADAPPPLPGSASARLFAWSAWSAPLLPWVGPTLAAMPLALCFAAPRWSGAMRARLDSWPMLRIYRDIQAIRFLHVLALLLRDVQATDARLAAALSTIAQHSPPWLRAHVHAMCMRLDAGVIDVSAFDTGLLDPPVYWFLADAVEARGLNTGLQAARERVVFGLSTRVANESLTWRWALLLGAVGLALGIAGWHFMAIDELRRGLAQTWGGG